MAGYFVSGNCYTSTTDAVAAYYSSIPPTIFYDSDLHIFQYLNSSNWQLYHFRVSSDGTMTHSVSAASPNVFLTGTDCLTSKPSEFFADGLTLGWGIAAACIAAWAIWIIRRGL